MTDWESEKAVGNDSYRLGRFEDAIVAWTSALELIPDDLPRRTPAEVMVNAPLPTQTDNSDAETAAFARAILSGNASEIERLRSKLKPVAAASTSSSLPPRTESSGDGNNSATGCDAAAMAAAPPPAAAAAPSEADFARALVLSNRAQARAQLRDPAGAADDCSRALSLLLLFGAKRSGEEHLSMGGGVGPCAGGSRAHAPAPTPPPLLSFTPSSRPPSLVSNSPAAALSAVQGLALKVLVRRALAYEELGNMRLSVGDLDRALGRSRDLQLPLPCLPPSLSKVALACRSRCLVALTKDQALLAKCTSGQSLVNKHQTLRLHLHGSVPACVASGERLEVLCNIANEFGLWRAKDFPSLLPPHSSPASSSLAADGGNGDNGEPPSSSPTPPPQPPSPAAGLLLPLRISLRAHNASAKRALPFLSVCQTFHHQQQQQPTRNGNTTLVVGGGCADESGQSMNQYKALTDLKEDANSSGKSSGSVGSSIGSAGNLGEEGGLGNGNVVWVGEDGRATMSVCITVRGGGQRRRRRRRRRGGDGKEESKDEGTRKNEEEEEEEEEGEDDDDEDEEDPTVFLEISPAVVKTKRQSGEDAPKQQQRPVMPVYSLPIRVTNRQPPSASESTEAAAEARRVGGGGGGGGKAVEVEELPIGAHIGAHSCRLTSVVAKNSSSGGGGGNDDDDDDDDDDDKGSSSSSSSTKPVIEIMVAESPGQLGIGGKVWDAALVLLHYLRHRKHELVENKRVLELGAGTGVVGIACSVGLGAHDVVITDLPDVCELIQVNILLNQPTAAASSLSSSSLSAEVAAGEGSASGSLGEPSCGGGGAQVGTMAAVPLAWSDPPPLLPPRLVCGPAYLSHAAATANTAAAAAATASTQQGGGVPSTKSQLCVDTVVLADVVYDPELYLPLVATLAALAPPPATAASGVAGGKVIEIVLAFRHRNPEDFRFWAALHAQGFTAKEEDLPALGLSDVVLGGGAAGDVQIFRLYRTTLGLNREQVAAAAADAAKPQTPEATTS